MTKEAFENAIAVDDGARRLDQRRAAPAGHRPRGAGRARARRLQPDRGTRAAHRRHEAARQVPHDRHRPHRRRAGGDEACCSTPGCSTATASPSPARPIGREPGRASIRPAPDGDGRPPAVATRSTPVGGIAVLTGSLAPKGVGGEGRRHRLRRASRARPGCSTARTRQWRPSSPASIKPGDVVVIRYEGPKGGPGMREMLAVTGAMKGVGRGRRLPRSITDGRFSRRHPRVLHRPRRARGGRRRADRVRRATATASASTCASHTIDLVVDDATLARAPGRLEAARAPLHVGRAGQVRQAGPRRRKGRHHALTPLSEPPSRNHCS